MLFDIIRLQLAMTVSGLEFFTVAHLFYFLLQIFTRQRFLHDLAALVEIHESASRNLHAFGPTAIRRPLSSFCVSINS